MDTSILIFATFLLIASIPGYQASSGTRGNSYSQGAPTYQTQANTYSKDGANSQILKMTMYGEDAPVLRVMGKSQNKLIPGRCERAGQFLRVAADRCMYQLCIRQMILGSNVPRFAPLPLSCPPGTRVPDNFNSGYAMPCTELDSSCIAKMPKVPKIMIKEAVPQQGASYMPSSKPIKVQGYPPLTKAEAPSIRMKAAEQVQGPAKVAGYGAAKRQEQPQMQGYGAMKRPGSAKGYGEIAKPKAAKAPGYGVGNKPKSTSDNVHSLEDIPGYPTYLRQLEGHQQQLLLHQQTEQVQKLRTAVHTPVTYPTPTLGRNGCHSMGQFIRDTANKCRYLVCTAGALKSDGSMSFVTVSLSCPKGTSVPVTFVHKEGGYSPCTVGNDNYC